MSIFVTKNSATSPCCFEWAWLRDEVESMDILMLYGPVLITACNTELCQGHLLTLSWQLLGWSWITIPHLHHSKPQLQSFPAIWSSGYRFSRCNVLNHRPETIYWKLFELWRLFVVTTCCSRGSAAACCIVNRVAWNTSFFCAVFWCSSIFAYCA